MQIVKNTTILFEPEKFWRRFGAPLNEKSAQLVVLQLVTLILAEREALEPTLSENIIKLQITDNHTLSTMQSKSKSF